MKPLRAAAVIRTDHGLLLGGDSYKDWHRAEVLESLEVKRENALRRGRRAKAERFLLAKSLVEDQGKLSLIGGTVDPADYLSAGVEERIDVESPRFMKELDQTMKVIRNTVVREVREELSLEVDPDSVKFVQRIIGANRNHIICTVFAQGEIQINHEEILGLGLITDHLPAIPQNHYFYQYHAVHFHTSYLHDEEMHKKIRKMPVSRLRVSRPLVYDLYRYQSTGRAYAHGKNNFSERETPKMLRSTRNFTIIDTPESSIPPSAETASISPPSTPAPFVGVVGKVPSDYPAAPSHTLSTHGSAKPGKS